MRGNGEVIDGEIVAQSESGASDFSALQKALSEGRDVLFDIDWQGAQQLYQQAGGDVIRVFIFPPSMDELERRLRSRGTDSNEVIEGRMSRASAEISHWDGYDYVLVNDDVESCFANVRTVLLTITA